METKADWDERIKRNLMWQGFRNARAALEAVMTGKSLKRGVLISGPPGVGKDYVVEEVRKHLNADMEPATIVSGRGLFDLLEDGHDFVFINECDKSFNSDVIDTMKKALDPDRHNRVISRTIKDGPLPFTTDTKFVCLTNSNWNSVKVLSDPHKAAIKSRMFSVFITFDRYQTWEYVVYQVLFGTLLRSPIKYSTTTINNALRYFTENLWKLPEVSARSLMAIADSIEGVPFWKQQLDADLLAEKDWITGQPIPAVPQIGQLRNRRKSKNRFPSKRQRLRHHALKAAAAAGAV